MNTTLSDWTEYFDALPSSTIINKGCMKNLFKTFDANVTKEEVMNRVEKHNETVFLARLSLRSGLNVFHHFIQVGGTVYSGDKEAGFFVGLHKSTAAKMTPDTDLLFETPHATAFEIPRKDDILNCVTSDDVKALVESNTVSYRARNFIPIPPFLMQVVVSTIVANQGNAMKILLEVISAIKTFDANFSSDGDYKEKATTECKPLLFWLYVAVKGSLEDGVKKIDTQPCAKIDLVQQLNKIEANILSQAENASASLSQSLAAPLEQLVVASKSTQETICKWASSQIQEKEKTTKGFNKIPTDYKRMLLIASGEGQAMPDELNKEAMDFFALPNSKAAHIHLNSLLESNKVRCSVSPAMANHLFVGSFRWSNMIKPSGLASSVLTSESYMREDILSEALVIDVSTRFEISSEFISKLTETMIVFPENPEDMIERFKAIKVLASYFFREDTVITQAYIFLLNWCQDNRQILEARCAMDKNLITKIMVSTDERMHLFLKSCVKADYPNKACIQYMNFSSITFAIEINSFNYVLQPSIKKLKRIPVNDEGGSYLKKPKGNGNDGNGGTRVVNNNMLEEWKLRAGESYETVFKDKVKKGPILSMGCRGCHKFHNKGWCYPDCNNIASHTILTGEDASKFGGYCKQCRGE